MVFCPVEFLIFAFSLVGLDIGKPFVERCVWDVRNRKMDFKMSKKNYENPVPIADFDDLKRQFSILKRHFAKIKWRFRMLNWRFVFRLLAKVFSR